ncbi:alpha-L-rhamnosidase N-terminal domain-containing protein [candidate division KSB1 bacterium]|nr:alpha-L-rhamnosidase N-terminal domain-containing protein [candidate division KSB1 bacterium]
MTFQTPSKETIEAQPRNFYLYLRKTFVLPAKARSAHVLVSADSRYQFFVNGTFVNRGPVRCDRRWQSYDEWDITKYLRSGKNAIAALVHHYGEWTFSYMLRRGGFICQADIVLTNGETLQLQTDDTWKVMPASSWEPLTPRLSIPINANKNIRVHSCSLTAKYSFLSCTPRRIFVAMVKNCFQPSSVHKSFCTSKCREQLSKNRCR